VSEQVAPATGERRPIRRALISVYDKAGLEDLARGLDACGVALVSTGSTAQLIAAAGVPVTKVEDLTGFPECLDGRVKTLHPKVHAGILADTRNPDHVRQLEELGVEPFDLVVSNLYPFRDTVSSGASEAECIEQIDIGGPSMVRAAAKNHASVAIVTSPTAYGQVLDAVAAGGFSLVERQRLAAQAFVHTASYDTAVATWMGTVLADTSDGTGFPAWTGTTWDRVRPLRYGENPHQQAALYAHWRPGIATAEQLHGKAMSYNNYVDADAAVRAAHDHGDQPTVAIVKHANPCGIAVGEDIAVAYAKAHACDPVSAFGGVIAANRPVTRAMAEQVAEVFTEVVVAPAYDADALEVLQRKKNVRLLQVEHTRPGAAVEMRAISGGLLLQLGSQTLSVDDGLLTRRPALRGHLGRDVVVGVRPEDMEDAEIAGGDQGSVLTCTADLVESMGSDVLVHFAIDAAGVVTEDTKELAKDVGGDLEPGPGGNKTSLVARVSPRSAVAYGQPLRLRVDTERLHVFDPETGLSIWADHQ